MWKRISFNCSISHRKGANIEAKDKDGWTHLHLPSLNGRTDVIRYLVSKRANKNGETPYDVAYNYQIRELLHMNIIVKSKKLTFTNILY